MSDSQVKEAPIGSIVIVPPFGLMQLWGVNGIKCLRRESSSGYDYFDVKDWSNIHLISTEPKNIKQVWTN